MAGRLEDPLGMRFILPEHAQALNELAYEKLLITQPILDDQELMEMSRLIEDSRVDDFAVSVTWFEPERTVDNVVLGKEESAWGWIQRIDMNRKQIKLVNDDGFWWIYFNRIMRIERV